ncbi:MAG: hypothetical protein A2Z31_06115 [candidate division NC10 bacterium RBG_16_65_8]|nr:MAG: hypothetical protein A2Z31_06115 [candidate division NC10 bacterium RBG_16_65_8]
MDFEATVGSHVVILTEGALIERLRRDATIALDPHVLHAGFIYSASGRDALRGLYTQYLDIGKAADLPMIVCTPTWRANPVRLQRAGLADKDVNRDAVRFLAAMRGEYGEYAGRVFIGGLVGCAGDAYKPGEALGAKEAARFHGAQTKALAAAGVDFLLAATLPNAGEAQGIAAAMAACRVPYALSFVVKGDGRLLDGTALHDAVAAIDASVNAPPLFYMVNCVHPTACEEAFASEASRAHRIAERVIGLQANASSKSPEELDGLGQLDADPPEVLTNAMLRVRRRFGTRILGGCCGTDHRHIAWLARRVKESARPIL